MKIKNIFMTCAVMMAALWSLSSCNDFLTIYPTDKIVGKDFWKTKEQVNNMVAGCYNAMISGDVQLRSIIWGAYRSDEMDKLKSYVNTDLENISAAILLPSNGYNSWGSFYTVINRCNIVLNHVDEVMAEDPQFTQGDCDEVCAQMRALRSLCYFYLVRTFRDVPYTKQSYEDDEQEMLVAQSSPDSVLNVCLEDLEWASHYILKSGAYGKNDLRNTGFFTRDAVYALMADIYLWRGAMTHDPADYENCIFYANKVIDAKDEYYRANTSAHLISMEDPDDKYHLIQGNSAFSIFSSGNSRESILEWQYDGERNSNTTLENLYFKTSESSGTSQLMGSKIFGKEGNSSSNYVYLTQNDYRFWDNVYNVNSTTAEQFSIRKFCNQSSLSYYLQKSSSSSAGQTKPSSVMEYSKYAQNWIVYRLTDVMLMKAEALVALAADDDDALLTDAYQLVRAVNRRSFIRVVNRTSSGTTETDSLKPSDYKGKANMELLVMAERERELCFEGKRWYDLMRYCYRHMEGVDITKKMSETTTWPNLYADMMRLVTRKYESGGESVIYKMKYEPHLYFPIHLSETKVNRLLIQNPVYEEEETISKQ